MKKKVIIISIIVFIWLLGVTYAWFLWSSSNNNVSFTMEGVNVTYNGGNNISGVKLIPVTTKEKGVADNTAIYKEISVSANREVNFNLYLDVNSLDNGLEDETFKWEIYKENTLINNGNFLNISSGDTINLMLHEKANTLTSLYKLYIYIDGSVDNKETLENKNYNFTLRADANDNPNEYVVTLDANGGNTSNNIMLVSKDGTYGSLPTPTRSGYRFLGWYNEIYQAVEYIESTGTQRIKTGYIPKANTKLELELSFNGTFNTSGGTRVLFNSPPTANGDAFQINFGGGSNQGNQLFPWFDKTSSSGGSNQNFYITDTIRTNKNTLTVEPGKIRYGSVSKTITLKSNNQVEELYLFGTKTYPFTGYNMRIYKLTLSENEEIKGVYIPCYRIDDGEIGLYDIIFDNFYTNIGTGTFNKGNNMSDNSYLQFQVLSSTKVVQDKDHILKAIWETIN